MTDQVRLEIDNCAPMEWLKCRVEKLVDWNLDLGDFSYDAVMYPDAPRIEPEEYIRSLPDVPSQHSLAPTYYEMLVPLNREVADRLPGATLCSTPGGPGPYADDIEFFYSEEIFTHYPIQRRPYWYIFTEKVLARLSPYLNPTFFTIFEVKV